MLGVYSRHFELLLWFSSCSKLMVECGYENWGSHPYVVPGEEGKSPGHYDLKAECTCSKKRKRESMYTFRTLRKESVCTNG